MKPIEIEVEEQKQDSRTSCVPILRSEHTCHQVWDMIQSMLLLITCILTPFNMAFSEDVQEIQAYMVFNYFIDFMFGLDMLVIFNTAIENEDQIIITNRCQIAKDYLNSWFIIDFLSIIPFEAFVELAEE